MTTLAKEQYDLTQEQSLPQQDANQYSLGQILGIWALATLPMALLGWVVAPAVIPLSPLHPGITYWILMIVGMAWQFIVALVILYRELGTLQWSVVRQRLWLQTPREPATGAPNARLYWWLLPLTLFDGLVAMVLAGYIEAPMAWLFSDLRPAPFMDMSQLASPAFQGQWWLLGIALVSFAFNYFLGEAFLWHGILLPKMQGVFGKYDWVANAVLFGLYHLHKPWAIPTLIITNMAFSWPARRFRSNWMAVAVHGVEALPVIVLVLAVILGLATG